MDIRIGNTTLVHIPPHLSLNIAIQRFFKHLWSALKNRDIALLRFAFWYLYRHLKVAWIVSETERKGLYDAAEHLTSMIELD